MYLVCFLNRLSMFAVPVFLFVFILCLIYMFVSLVVMDIECAETKAQNISLYILT